MATILIILGLTLAISGIYQIKKHPFQLKEFHQMQIGFIVCGIIFVGLGIYGLT